MIKILLITAGGMSTSLLVTKMNIEAQIQGVKVDIITVIDIKDYGMMNGKNVLNTALKMYNEFYKL